MADLSAAFDLMDSAMGQSTAPAGALPASAAPRSLMGAPPVPSALQFGPAVASTTPAPAGPTMNPGPNAIPLSGPRPLTVSGGSRSTFQDGLDQIDAALAQPKGATPSLDAAGPASNNGRPPIAPSQLAGDALQSLGTGIERGAIGLLGAPADLSSFGDRIMNKGVNAARGWMGKDPIPPNVGDAGDPANYIGSAPITKGVEAVAGPMYQPKSVLGDYAKTIGEFVPGATGGVAAGIRTAAEEAPTLLGKLFRGAGGAVAPAITDIALPAATSEAAGQATQGTSLEPYARIAGGIAGGAALAAGKGGSSLAGVAREAAAPFTAAGQERAAATTVRDAMQAPETTVPALAQDGTLVPGSQPTAFQQTGDLGLGQLERQARNNPQRAPKYIAQDAAQNAARARGIDTVAPDASPVSVADAFTAQKRSLEAQGDQAIGAATTRADQATQAMGGTGTIDTYGRAIGNDLAPRYQGIQDAARDQVAALGGDRPAASYGQDIKAQLDPAYRTSQDAARSQVDALGGQGAADARGAALRGPAQDASIAANDQLRTLYDAVPDDVATNITGLKRLARTTYGNAEPAIAATFTPAERTIADTLGQYGNNVPFASARAIDTLLTSSMRQELRTAGRTPAYRRMVQMKDAWETSVHNGIAQRTAADDAAVASGTMAPDATVASRINNAVSAPASGSTVYTPSGSKIDVDYRVVDAGNINASHLDDGRPNPAYPPELQPRDRSRLASDAQVADIAQNLQPERLGGSSSAAEGAPIVGPDGHVESGNGRVLGIQRAYAKNGSAAQRYRDYLEGQGYDTAGMQRPILVRQRTTMLSPADRVRFTQEANASPVLTASAAERAMTDANRLGDDTLSLYQGGDVGSAGNRAFARSFLRDVATKGEEGGFIGPDGAVSLDGQRRVQNALLHSAYDDPRLVTALAETGDENIRAFGHVMQDTAGRMAQLRRAIDAGQVNVSADLASPMQEAAHVVQRARSTGQPLATIVAQQDAFQPISDEALHVLQTAYGQTLAGRLNRSRMGTAIGQATDEALQQSTEARLFGESLTAHDILANTSKRYGSGAETADPIPPGPGPAGPRNGTRGDQARGPEHGPAGPGSPGASQAGWRQAATGQPLEQADLNALNRAKALTKENKQTFASGPIGTILRPGPTSNTYRIADSAVPDAVFPQGAGGFEAVQAYRRAVGSDEQAIGTLHDTAAASLRRAALREDGTLDPGKYAGWRTKYAEALRGVPELRQGFDTAAHAADTLDRFGTYAPEREPSTVPDLFFGKGPSGGDGVRQLQTLVADKTAANTSLAGFAAYSLRKAALKDDGTLDPRRFATWQRDHAEALANLPPALSQQFANAARAAVGLKRFGAYTPDIATSQVPDLFFHPGPAGADGVRLLRSLVGDNAASDHLGDYAAFSMRSKVMGEDGSFNTRAADTWLKAHGPALRELPPEIRQRFADATSAQKAIEDATAAKRAEVDAFNGTAAAKLVGVSDPDVVVKRVATILKAPDATAQMRSMVQAAETDPAALAGLKRAVAETVKGRALSVNEAGVSGVNQMTNQGFTTFMRQSGPALREVLSPAEYGSMLRIGEDLTRANRSINATKGNKGSSNTPQDVRGFLQEAAHKGGILGSLIAHGGSVVAGGLLGGPIGGMVGLVGSKTAEAAYTAGLRRIDDLVDEAMLNPSFAATLLAKLPAKADEGTAASLRVQFGRIGRATVLGLAAGQALGASRQKKQAGAR